MTLTELGTYILGNFEAQSDHSFEKGSTVTVYSRTDNRKWFAAAKNIGCRYVDVDRSGRVDILNVKLDPRMVTSLRTRDGFRPAWGMNRNSWVTILLDGTVPDDEIRTYLEMSYKYAGIKGRKR